MALAVGSIVLIPFASTDFPENLEGPDACPQPPHWGVVAKDQGAGAFDILWDNGILDASVVVASAVEELFPVSANSRSTFWGRTVAVLNESCEYYGQVIAMYRRGTDVSDEKALVYQFSNGTYRELNVSQLTVVGGL